MRKTIWHNRIWLAIVAGILLVAPAAFADEHEPVVEVPSEEEENEASGSWVVSWTLEGDTYTIVTTDGESETTTEVAVTDQDGDGLSHGDYVSSFQEAVPHGPGRGCIISQVARSDAGKPQVDEEEEVEEGEDNRGCPEGLYEWLNSEDKGSGPPPWAGGPNGGGEDDEGEDSDVEGASRGRPAHAGPPAGAGGPP